MARRRTPTTPLQELMQLALPVCQQAQQQHPYRGPGRPATIPEWFLAVLIMVAILRRKKTKSAQYRYLVAHRSELCRWAGGARFPARSTYFERYRRAHRLFRHALALQGR